MLWNLACAKLYFSIRPYNPEGISLIRSLEFVEQHVWRVDGQTAVVLMETAQTNLLFEPEGRRCLFFCEQIP